MGRVGRLLVNEIEKIVTNVVETRFGLNQVCDQFSPSGDDSPPLPQESAFVQDSAYRRLS